MNLRGGIRVCNIECVSRRHYCCVCQRPKISHVKNKAISDSPKSSSRAVRGFKQKPITEKSAKEATGHMEECARIRDYGTHD